VVQHAHPAKSRRRVRPRFSSRPPHVHALPPPLSPLAGEVEGRIPLRLLDQIHTPEGRKEALAAEPKLEPLLGNVSFPAISTTTVGPLFTGTLRFVRVEFTIEDRNNAIFAVSNEDIATAIAYAAQAAPAISAYAARYGPNTLVVCETIFAHSVTLPTAEYALVDLENCVNSVAAGLPSDTCLVVLNPREVVNTSIPMPPWLGFHSAAHVPYVFVNLLGRELTIADRNDHFALGLSHEIAEMVADPLGDDSNPEVCDPCGPNCQAAFRSYFANAGAYVTTAQPFPPGHDYDFFINAIVTPGLPPCPPAPPAAACAWSPEQPV
jgi:hypothetical protein